MKRTVELKGTDEDNAKIDSILLVHAVHLYLYVHIYGRCTLASIAAKSKEKVKEYLELWIIK